MNCQLNYYRNNLQVEVNCEEHPLKHLKFWNNLCQDITDFQRCLRYLDNSDIVYVKF